LKNVIYESSPAHTVVGDEQSTPIRLRFGSTIGLGRGKRGREASSAKEEKKVLVAASQSSAVCGSVRGVLAEAM